MEAVYIPAGKFVAVELKLTITVDCPPETNAPPVDETLSQEDVLIKDQFSDEAPVLFGK
jgi:hypothetical protein